jgi:hypothetical protein
MCRDRPTIFTYFSILACWVTLCKSICASKLTLLLMVPLSNELSFYICKMLGHLSSILN